MPDQLPKIIPFFDWTKYRDGLVGSGSILTQSGIGDGGYASDFFAITNAHVRRMCEAGQTAWEKNSEASGRIGSSISAPRLGNDLVEYLVDFSQRSVLFL